MIVEFMVEYGEEMVSDLDYTVVDECYQGVGLGYEIYRVEVNSIDEIVVTICGRPHKAVDTVRALSKGIKVDYVSLWDPIE